MAEAPAPLPASPKRGEKGRQAASHPPRPGARPAPGAAAVGLAGLLSLAVAMGIGRFSFTPLLPLMIQDGQLDLSAAGWIASANYLGYLLGALSAARLRLTPIRLAMGALLLTVALIAAMGLPLGAWGWAAVRLAAGAASAWAFVGTSVWCLQALARRPDAQGRPSAWASVLYAGVGSGIALSGLYCLVGATAGAGAAALWLQLAGVALLMLLPVAAVVRRLRGELAQPSSDPQDAAQASRRPVRGLMLSYALFGFGYILPATFLPEMARTLVPDPRLFGLAWPVFGLMGAGSALLASRLLRRMPRLKLWSVTQGLMGVGVLLPSLWLSGWTIALSALFVGGTFMVATLAGLQEARARAGADASRVMAGMTTGFAAGQIAGPIAANLLRLWPGASAAGALDLALQLAAAGLLASALWLWRTDSA